MCVVHVVAICARSLLLLLSFLRCLPFIPLVPWCILSLSCLFGLRTRTAWQSARKHKRWEMTTETMQTRQYKSKTRNGTCRNAKRMKFLVHLEHLENHSLCLLKHSRTPSTNPRSFLDASRQFSRKLENHEILEFFGTCPGPCSTIFSGQRDRFREFPRPNWSYRPKDGSGTPLAKSCVKEASYNHLKGAKTTHNQLPWKSSFSLHPYYSSSRKGFPSHFRVMHQNFGAQLACAR